MRARMVALMVLSATAATGCGGHRPELQELAAAVVRGGAPSALVLVRQDGRARIGAAGAAPRARFRIGSVTKVFTATLVMRLVEEGRLGLQDPAPGLPGATVADLLGHRSGLYDHGDDPQVVQSVARDPGHRWRPAELVAAARRHPRRRVGRFAYSSTNYVVLEQIARRAGGGLDGLPGQLGLRRTSYEPGVWTPARGDVRGHVPLVHDGFVRRPRAEDDRSAVSGSWTAAAGAMVSNADDVARFLEDLLAGRILRPATVRRMLPPARPGRRTYGLGLARHPVRCGLATGHTGNVNGTVTVALSRAGRTVVAVAGAHPLPAAAETAFKRMVDEALCGG